MFFSLDLSGFSGPCPLTRCLQWMSHPSDLPVGDRKGLCTGVQDIVPEFVCLTALLHKA